MEISILKTLIKYSCILTFKYNIYTCIFNDFIMLGDENNGQEREDNNRTNA